MNPTRQAIDALRKQIQRIAFDANLYDRGLADYPWAESCSKKRKELLAAIATLEGPKQLPLPGTLGKK